MTSPSRSSISSSSESASVPSYALRGPSSATSSSARTRPGCWSVAPAGRSVPVGGVDARALVHRHDRLRSSPGMRRAPAGTRRRSGRGAGPARRPAPRADARAPRAAPRARPGAPGRRTRRCRRSSGRSRSRTRSRPRAALSRAARRRGPGRRRSSRGSERGRSAVEVDRVAAAEQPGHDRLGDARGERGRDRRVGGRATLLENLDPASTVAGCPAATAACTSES